MVESIAGEWAASVDRGGYVRFVKPLIDRLGALVLLCLATPLVVAIVLLLFATQGSPTLYRQRRVGRGGRLFTMYKFRTMQPDRRRQAGDYEGPERRQRHKTAGDPRITRFGAFLRKWSLDELPQLWNVLAGHMSLVGPRPEMVDLVARYEPWQHRRHSVKPGITGLWQISARGDLAMHEATHLDIAYVDSVSFWADLKILALTIPAALGRRRGF